MSSAGGMTPRARLVPPFSRRGHAGGPRSGVFLDADAEALQTDVMRFMALLGFVLVGIFALVQTIPLTSENRRPALEQRAQLRNDIVTLQEHIVERRRELEQIRATVAAALAVRNELLAESRTTRRELERAAAKIPAVKEELARHRAALERIDGELAGRRRTLQSLRIRVEQRRAALREVQQRFAELRNRASEAERLRQQFLADAQRALEAEARSQEAPEPTESKRPPAPEESPAASTAGANQAQAVPETDATRAADDGGVPKRGFVLKFESDAAFNQLVERRSVEFYALVGDRAWRASHRDGITRFTGSRPPARYHEMAPATVPRQYSANFRSVVAAMDQDDVTWAAVLPASLSRRIRQVIAGETAGEVVIQGDGSIRFDGGR